MKTTSNSTVELLDHMGTDLSIVNAARVSFSKWQEEFTEGDLREFMCDFLVAYAEYRNQPPLLNASIARVVGKMIEYAGAYSKHVSDAPTAEELWDYEQDMKTHKWEARRDY